MQQSLVMTLLGEDRPGLVDALASIVADHGGNWLESQLSRLGGQFAGIVRVEVPPEKEQALVLALKNLSTRGLNVIVQSDRSGRTSKPHSLNLLEIVGQDRPGIIRQISHALAEFGVNVEQMHTECSSAAMSGETLFKARAQLSIPDSCNVEELRRTLEKIAADLIVDISLAPLQTAAQS